MAQPIYFEDMNVGDVHLSPGRTVTETDVVNFAGLSGDYMPLHTDKEFCKDTVWGERIAHGLLGLSLASGLFTRTELAAGIVTTVIALLGLEWKFTAPIMLGDTIHVEVEIIKKKETKKADRGVVTLQRTIKNQRGEVVQQGVTPLMFKRKPTE